jgi:hypothetical protein
MDLAAVNFKESDRTSTSLIIEFGFLNQGGNSIIHSATLWHKDLNKLLEP